MIAFTSFKTGQWLFFWNCSIRENFWTDGIVLSNWHILFTSMLVSRKLCCFLEMLFQILLIDL